MLTLLTLAALLACNQGAPPPGPSPSGSALAEALRRAAQATPPEPDHADIPDRLARESDRTVQTDGSADSEACTKAKRARDQVKKRVQRQYKDRVTPAEDRAWRAKVALDECLRDLGGCGANPDRYKAIADRSVSTARFLQAEMNAAGEQEAKLYPLNREVSRACGLGRF